MYRVLDRLGSGSQGVVYLAEAPSGAWVAIKRLLSGGEDNTQERRQLAKEVAAARLVAPFCTAQLLDVRLEGPSPYVVSEYIPGPTLSHKVRRDGPMTGAALQRTAIGTVTALAAIHRAGVVHRDFKPANVMLSPDGPRVIDFGIARDLATDLTETSRVVGTPAYMSPEQLRNEPVEPAADMFAWACVMVFAATGRTLFDGKHVMAVAYQILSGEPTLSGVPDGLRIVLERCLAQDPARRPTAEQVLAMLLGRPEPVADLDLLIRGSRIAEAATPVPPLVPPGDSPHRRRGVMTSGRRIVLGGVLLGVLTAGGWVIGHGVGSDRVPVAVGSGSPGGEAGPAGLPSETLSRTATPTATRSAVHTTARKKQTATTSARTPSATRRSTPSATEKRVASVTGTASIVGIAAQCLDIANARSENGTQVQIVPCNESKAQIWTARRDGTVRALGKCLNVAGRAVEINECDGTGDQTWRIASGVIVNAGSGRCLGTKSNGSKEYTPAVVAACSGAAGQVWSFRV
ncbi:protein kinase [Kineosporia mesophila]|uniref:serine/threonine protein kinase n=1 Tax=Kineosporia mesophila TaxID=566012 RepID=UPI001E448570|nr:protein kinase [Kineosporia mesophila]